MKKIIICGYWFYTFAAIILTAVAITINVICILSMVYQSEDNFLPVAFAILFFCTIALIFAFGNFTLQFTLISENGIKTRAVWRAIRSIKWDEVKEVRYEKFHVSVLGGFTSGWYIIDDGVERKQFNGLVRKNSHITVRATKRARKAIEAFWHGIIVEKQISN